MKSLRIALNSFKYKDKEAPPDYSKITWISIFLLITVDSSFFMIASISGTARIIINIISVILLAAINRKFTVHKNTTIFMLLFAICTLLSGFIFNNIKQTTILLSCILCGYVCTAFVKKDIFIYMYTKIIIFLAIYSLIVLTIYFIFNNFIYMLPLIGIRGGVRYYNAIFSVLSNNSYVLRNYGLFWEPGAFSIFLNIALYFEIFHKKQINYKNILILVATILTTLSTLGIACMFLLSASFTQSKAKQKGKTLWVIVLIIASIFLFTSNYFTFHVLGKLQVNQEGMLSSTTIVRLNSLIYSGAAFLKSPLLGVGYTTFLLIQKEKCFNMATFTYLNWLCIYGLLGGLLPCVGCIKFFIKKNGTLIENIILTVFSILLFSTENFITITFIYIIIFYSFEHPTNAIAISSIGDRR